MSNPDWDREEREALDGLQPELEALLARHAGDPPIELLRAAREGVLPDAMQARVSAHLERSAWSRTLADDVTQVAAGPTGQEAERMLARVHAGVRRESSASRLTWRPVLAFCSLAAAVVLLAVLPNWGRTPVRPPAGTIAGSSTAPPVPTPPATPVMVLALAKPDLRVSLAVLQWRGSAATNPLLGDLKPAYAAFERDDFGEAVRLLAPLATRYPQSVEVFFYLGVSRLFLDDGPGAREALETATRVADEAFAADVAWYLAIAEERTGNRSAARQRIDALCRAGGARGAAACEAAPKLQ